MNDDEKHVSLADLYDRGLTAKARVEERERCAKVVEAAGKDWHHPWVRDIMRDYAAAIRALGDE
jgi:hypothetical protein